MDRPRGGGYRVATRSSVFERVIRPHRYQYGRIGYPFRYLVRAAAICGVTLCIACGTSSNSERVEFEERLDEESNLADGSYTCNAFNVTRANGPYTLNCDKFGPTVTIHFNNGGYIDLDVDSESSVDGSLWSITGINPDDGEGWELNVRR